MDHQMQVSDSVDRVIHIPLSEAEWQAFLASTPQADRLAARADPGGNRKIRKRARSQIPNPNHLSWDFSVVSDLELGIWDLGFGILFLGRVSRRRP